MGFTCLVGVATQAPPLGARVLDLDHTLESPGENLKNPVPRLHPRLINSESLGAWPRHQVAFKAPKHPNVQLALRMAGLDTASLKAGEEGVEDGLVMSVRGEGAEGAEDRLVVSARMPAWWRRMRDLASLRARRQVCRLLPTEPSFYSRMTHRQRSLSEVHSSGHSVQASGALLGHDRLGRVER